MGHSTVLLKLRLGLILVGALLCSMFISIEPAFADLRVCNQTGNPVSIALGYRAERGWQSEGWWVATPSQCATVYQGTLNTRFFYLYVADDIGGGAWDGSVYMCTRDETFTIFGVEDCLARGYERTGFFEVDTQNKSDWTLQLTDPAAGADTPVGTDNPDPNATGPATNAPDSTAAPAGLDGPKPGDAPPGLPPAGDTKSTD
jgi:uncharacterized membrane protein